MSFERWEPPEVPPYHEKIKNAREKIQASPHEVFDSSIEDAQAEAELLDTIIDSEIGTHDDIIIPWTKNGTSTMLKLTPVTEGKSKESSIYYYTGTYGQATEKREWLEDPTYEFAKPPQTIQELFGFPDDFTVKIIPTIGRWALEIGNLEDRIPPFSGVIDPKTVRLYMGIGTLLIDHSWMHVGYHERGHIASDKQISQGELSNPNENSAWQIGNALVAQKQRQHRNQPTSEQQDNYTFDILERPLFKSDLTISRLMKFGLISHHLNDQTTHAPQQWLAHKDRIMQDLDDEICKAYDAAEKFFNPNQ